MTERREWPAPPPRRPGPAGSSTITAAARTTTAWLGALALSVACSNGTADPDTDTGPPPDDPPAQFHEADLDALEVWMSLDASWPPGALAQARDRVAELRTLRAQLPDTEFWLAVAEVVALADNGHSNVSRLAVYNRWRILPIRAFWFSDGLFIVRASPAHGDLLGGEIIAIAGMSPEALADRMGRYHGGSDEHLRAYFIHSLLMSPAVLEAAGVSASPTRVPVTVRLRGGGEVTVDMDEFPATAPFALPWRYLSPEPIGGENGWVTVLANSAAVPWALQEPSRPFRYRYLPDAQVSHVQFRANRDLNGQSINSFIEQVENRIAADAPRHVIVDNRENDGGSLDNTARWAFNVHRALPEDGLVFSLTSHATFSAGIYTAFYPEWAWPGRTVVVGSLVGDRARFFAEGSSITLPESGHRIRYSDLAHDLTARCGTPDCLFENVPEVDIIVATLAPDVSGDYTFEAFATGRDADVERALQLIAGGS